MAKPNADATALVQSIYNGIKKYGIQKIEQKLSELTTSKPKSRQSLIKSRILKEVSAVYGVSPRIFMRLFSRHLTASQAEIAAMFHIPVTVCYARIRNFKRVVEGNPVYEKEKHFEKIYHQDEFMLKIDMIDSKINEFVNTETEPLTDWRKW